MGPGHVLMGMMGMVSMVGMAGMAGVALHTHGHMVVCTSYRACPHGHGRHGGRGLSHARPQDGVQEGKVISCTWPQVGVPGLSGMYVLMGMVGMAIYKQGHRVVRKAFKSFET